MTHKFSREEDMMDNPRLTEISELRATIKQVVHGQPVPDRVIQLARDAVQTMFQAATEHGLTQAEEDQIRRWRIGQPQQVMS